MFLNIIRLNILYRKVLQMVNSTFFATWRVSETKTVTVLSSDRKYKFVDKKSWVRPCKN